MKYLWKILPLLQIHCLDNDGALLRNMNLNPIYYNWEKGLVMHCLNLKNQAKKSTPPKKPKTKTKDTTQSGSFSQ